MWALEVEVRAAPGVPAPVGTHELAWGLLLDRIFADAFHAGIAALRFTLPRDDLPEAVRLRGELTGPRPGARGTGVASLAGGAGATDGAGRLYTLEAGRPAAAVVRRALPPVGPLPGWRLEEAMGLYGWRPRLLGVPVRLAGLLHSPLLADRAMRAVRAGFERPGPGTGAYRLKVWGPA